MPRILAIDDVPDNLALLAMELKDEGFTVETAMSGETGLELASANPPDLMLLDIMMPEMDGFDVLRVMRGDDRLKEIPVILLSCRDDEASMVLGLDLGASDYATKPFTMGVLLARIRSALRIKSDQDTILAINDDLNDARRAAEAASASKSEFLANMSHEIRTPLTAILGYTELLREPELTDELRLEYARVIHNNGDHLLTILNDILDLSKFEAGHMSVEAIGTSPFIIAEQVSSLQGATARGKGLDYVLEFVDKLPATFTTDPTRVRQILLNLLSNAIKFTEAGSITLRVELERSLDDETGNLLFHVIDTGMGLTVEQQEGLFRPFVQADNTTTRTHGGTGLGLTLCRRFAELLGGAVSLTSEPGAGSTFSLSLPAGRIVDEDLIDSVQARESRDTAVAAPLGSLSLNGRILLAEDSPDNQRLISHILRKAGADVEIVSNGRIAVDEATAEAQGDRPFDLILMDMQMPEMDGYEAARTLRGRGMETPIIALTANAMAADRERCLKAGCDDFASKPLRKDPLLRMLWQYLNDAAAGRSIRG